MPPHRWFPSAGQCFSRLAEGPPATWVSAMFAQDLRFYVSERCSKRLCSALARLGCRCRLLQFGHAHLDIFDFDCLGCVIHYTLCSPHSEWMRVHSDPPLSSAAWSPRRRNLAAVAQLIARMLRGGPDGRIP